MKRNRDIPIVCIVACARSGTTWVLRLLAEHPDTVHATMDNLGIPHRGLSYETGLFVKRYRRSAIRKMVTNVSQQHPKKLIVEKTPSHLHVMKRIQRTFPWAKFVLCLRDGRDVVVSMLEAKKSFWRGAPESFREALDRWKACAEDTAKAMKKTSDVYCVRYETLVAHPYNEVMKLYSKMNLSCKTGLIYQALHETSQGRGIELPGVYRKGTVGEWQTYLTDEQKQIFRHEGERLLADLGYEWNE